MRKGEATRSRMIEAAAALFEREGYSGAGLQAILEASDAPRGSLYFHFPNGKEELAMAAVEASESALLELVDGALASSKSLAQALERVVLGLAERLESSAFQKGCPVASVVVASSAAPESVRARASQALATLEGRIASALRDEGMTPRDAARRASLVLSSVEGALVLGRIHRSTSPLRSLARDLPRLIAP